MRETLASVLIDRKARRYKNSATNIGGNNMTQLDELKLKLLEYKRTKSLTKAIDICEYLYDELIKKHSEVNIDARH